MPIYINLMLGDPLARRGQFVKWIALLTLAFGCQLVYKCTKRSGAGGGAGPGKGD